MLEILLQSISISDSKSKIWLICFSWSNMQAGQINFKHCEQINSSAQWWIGQIPLSIYNYYKACLKFPNLFGISTSIFPIFILLYFVILILFLNLKIFKFIIAQKFKVLIKCWTWRLNKIQEMNNISIKKLRNKK